MRPTLLHPSTTSRPLPKGRLTAYVVREHLRGRPLREILADPFVLDHASESETKRLLDDPDLIRRLADNAVTSEGLPPAA
jgi:hypothetical protein